MRNDGGKKYERNLVSRDRLANEDFGQERYVKEFGSKGEVRTVSVGLLGNKERCGCVRMVNVYDEGVVEEVHFLLLCGKFAGDRERLLGVIVERTEEWMTKWRNKGDEGRVGLLLGRSVAGVKV